MGKPKPDQFDEMLKNWKTLLPELRDKLSRSNCPLTAQAVWNYFHTGKVQAPQLLLNVAFVMVECGDAETIELKDVKPRMKRKPHGAHAVLTVNPGGPKEHSVVVVNIRGVVYMVDSYNQPGVFTQDLQGYLSYGKHFEITFNASIRMVPADQAKSYKCRK